MYFNYEKEVETLLKNAPDNVNDDKSMKCWFELYGVKNFEELAKFMVRRYLASEEKSHKIGQKFKSRLNMSTYMLISIFNPHLEEKYSNYDNHFTMIQISPSPVCFWLSPMGYSIYDNFGNFKDNIIVTAEELKTLDPYFFSNFNQIDD